MMGVARRKRRGPGQTCPHLDMRDERMTVLLERARAPLAHQLGEIF